MKSVFVGLVLFTFGLFLYFSLGVFKPNEPLCNGELQLLDYKITTRVIDEMILIKKLPVYGCLDENAKQPGVTDNTVPKSKLKKTPL